MHILILNFEYPPIGGGASPVCHEINKRYVLAGHQVTVVTMLYKGLERFEIMDGVAVHRVPSLRRHIHMSRPHEQMTYIINAWGFLKTFLKTHTVEVCHAHFILPTGILCRRLKKKYGIPSIITSHGSDIPRFNPDRFTFLHLWTPPFIQSIVSDASYITSPSTYLAGLIQKVLQKEAQNIVIIPNGIDTSQYFARLKENYIVSSGRLLPRKGFQDLIEAVKELDVPIHLHILGDGPMRMELEKSASTSRNPITFHGWIDNRSTAYKNLFASASIYVLVSLQENASVSILEAMASGCAIITSDTSGCPEMVLDTGILVPPGQVEEIKQAILNLMANEDLRKSLSHKAQIRAQTYYDWNNIVDQYLQLLTKINPSPNP